MQPEAAPLPEVPLPAPALQKSPVSTEETMSKLQLPFVIIAIIIASIGVSTDAWMVQEESSDVFGTTVSVEMNIGLDDTSATSCMGDECTTVEDDLGGMYDNCTSDGEDIGATQSEIDESCGPLKESATAGLVGMIFISLGIIALLASATISSRKLESYLPLLQSPLIGSTLILTGIVLWALMKPDMNELGLDDASLGYSAWLTITSTVFGTVAGIFNSRTSDEYEHRVAGIGARALGEDDTGREFVLQESALGNRTISIVEDGELFRLTTTTREGDTTRTEDKFMTQLNALNGFTHSRFDWLDTTRYLWNIIAIGGLALSLWSFGSTELILFANWFILMFAAGTMFSLMQYADPELIVFETNTGKHRLLIYRAGTNRELTNTSMDLIDSVMRGVLRGEEIDSTQLTEKAEQIEKGFANARKEREEAVRIAVEAAAARAAAKEAERAAKVATQAQAQATSPTPTTPPSGATPPAPMPSPPAPMPAPPVTASPPAPMPAPPAPMPAPPVTASPPAPMPAPPAPMPAPPVTASPPAPMPAPPAPLPTPQAPMPAPLPPPSAPIDMSPPTQTITPAPEVATEAAPRDDSLSEGEKENLLSDLEE
ncbi:MAG: hypothetical protein QF454_05075 [Candidatus Thalassarchaeaceae archaeon]|nr:hypothetical protein [Candidatus Thalassarchaeaceae archaeon]